MIFSVLHPKKLQSQHGFTLIELIVVIAIIAILSVLIGFSITEMISRGKVAKAQGDLNRIAKAIRMLEIDTSRSANYEPAIDDVTTGAVETCRGDGTLNEFFITPTDNRSGLFTATHVPKNVVYPNWKGPYIEENLVDPWGNSYYYDGDYYCQDNESSKLAKGCEKYKDLPAGTYQRAIFSMGPEGGQGYDDNNVVLVLCVET